MTIRGEVAADVPSIRRVTAAAFANQPIEREALYWEHEGNAAVRAGDWKLVRLGAHGAWELYDLAADRTEAGSVPRRASTRTSRSQSSARRFVL